MNRRQFLRAGATTLALGAVGACIRAGSEGSYVLASGEIGGFQSEFAGLLVTAVAGGPIALEERNTAGSVQNIELIRSGAVTFGLSLADSAADAAAASGGLAAVGRLYENYVQFAVVADSPLNSFADLRGQPVSLGARGSGTEHTGLRVLAAAGLTPDDIVITPVSLTTVLESLANGTVVAAMWAGGVPTPSAIPRPGYGPPSGIRLLNLSTELEQMRRTYGAIYEPVSVRAGMYGGSPETPTIGVPSMMLAAPTAPDAAVSAVVDVLVGKPTELIPPGTVGVQFLDRQSLLQVYGVPMHPGAAAAYRWHHG